jgi:hypothetical protein
LKEQELIQLKLLNENSLFASELNSIRDLASRVKSHRPKTPPGPADHHFREQFQKMDQKSILKQDLKLLSADMDPLIIQTVEEAHTLFCQKWLLINPKELQNFRHNSP